MKIGRYTGWVGRFLAIFALLLVANAVRCVATCSVNECVPASEAAPPCHQHEQNEPRPAGCAHAGFNAVLTIAPLIAMEAAVVDATAALSEPALPESSAVPIRAFAIVPASVPSSEILRI